MPVDREKLASILSKLRGENVSYGEIAKDAIEELTRVVKEEDAEIKHIRVPKAHQMHMQSLTRRMTGSSLLHHDEILDGAHYYDNPSGIYFLIKGNEVVYVGQSVNVISRISDHYSNIKFTRYAFVPAEKKHLDLMESLYIHFLRPKFNGMSLQKGVRDLAAPIPFQKLLDMVLKAETASASVIAESE